jgi:hypothetical protein
MRIKLSNAVDITQQYPQRVSDYPPNYQQIAELTPEDFVQIKSRGEKFWVKVDAVDPYVGIVQDDPIFEQKFMKGDKIYFEAENIYDLRSKWWLNKDGI